MDNKQAYAYIRYSHKKQSEGTSFQRQIESAKQYCEKNNLALSDHVFYDSGKSGYAHISVRDDFKKMLEMISNGDISYGSWILFENVDRMTRGGAKEALRLLTAITDRCNVAIFSGATGSLLEYRLDEKDDVLNFINLVIDSSRSHKESKEKSSRVSDGWNRKKEFIKKEMASIDPLKTNERTILTDQIPAHLKLNITGKVHIEGMKKKYKKGYFEVKNGYQEAIERVFNYALDERSDQYIASQLNNDIELNKLLGEEKNGKFVSKTWNSTEINRLIRRKTVLGEYQPRKYIKVNTEHLNKPEFVHKGKMFDESDLGKRFDLPEAEVIENYYPKVIDEELYNEVKRIRLRRTNKKEGKTGSKNSNILVTLVKCEYCGGSLQHTAKGKKKEHHVEKVYLRCRKAYENRGCSTKTLFDYKLLEKNLLKYCDHINLDLIFDETSDHLKKLKTKRNSLEIESQRLTENIELLNAEMDLALDKKDNDLLRGFSKKLGQTEDRLEVVKSELEEVLQEISFATKSSKKTNAELHDLIEKVSSSDEKEIRRKLNNQLKDIINKIVCFYDNETEGKYAVILFMDGIHQTMRIDIEIDDEYTEQLVSEFTNQRSGNEVPSYDD
ncbi:recombinase family protein [Endozoicomonas acroporae]|uniref:recombinase family protein n=1 Tax=Endozoicomonas acroporae TaxID=1701104 RepID=UPI003D793C00